MYGLSTTCTPGAHRGQNTVLYPLELELQVLEMGTGKGPQVL